MLHIVNEARAAQDPFGEGSITVFNSEIQMTAHLEPWYAGENYLLLREDGRRLKLVEVGSDLLVGDHDDDADYKEMFCKFLCDAVRAATWKNPL